MSDNRHHHNFYLFRLAILIVGICLGTGFPALARDDGSRHGTQSVRESNFPWWNESEKEPIMLDPDTTDLDASAARNTVGSATPKQARSQNSSNSNQGWSFGNFTWLLWFIMVGVIALAFTLAMVYLLWIADLNKKDSLILAKEDVSQKIQALPFQLDGEQGDCRQLAEKYYRDGNFQKAIIYLFSHALIYLDKHHVVQLRKGKTNRQYLRESRGQPVASHYLNQLLEPFESVFFGDHELPRDEFELVWAGLPHFERHVLESREGA